MNNSTNLDWIYTKFKSSNGVPVKQAVVKRDEFIEMLHELRELYEDDYMYYDLEKLEDLINLMRNEDIQVAGGGECE